MIGKANHGYLPVLRKVGWLVGTLYLEDRTRRQYVVYFLTVASLDRQRRSGRQLMLGVVFPRFDAPSV